jgi:hypothetical protein
MEATDVEAVVISFPMINLRCRFLEEKKRRGGLTYEAVSETLGMKLKSNVFRDNE